MSESVGVSVDQHACVGTGFCVRIAPTLFELDADGYSSPTADVVPADLVDLAREAETACPAAAIEVADSPATPA